MWLLVAVLAGAVFGAAGQALAVVQVGALRRRPLVVRTRDERRR